MGPCGGSQKKGAGRASAVSCSVPLVLCYVVGLSAVWFYQ